MEQRHHPKSDVETIHLPRSEQGRSLAKLGIILITTTTCLQTYLENARQTTEVSILTGGKQRVTRYVQRSKQIPP